MSDEDHETNAAKKREPLFFARGKERDGHAFKALAAALLGALVPFALTLVSAWQIGRFMSRRQAAHPASWLAIVLAGCMNVAAFAGQLNTYTSCGGPLPLPPAASHPAGIRHYPRPPRLPVHAPSRHTPARRAPTLH